MAERIKHHGIVEAACPGLAHGAGGIGIVAGRLGVGWRIFERRPAERRYRHGKALRRRQRRVIDRDREFGRLRIDIDKAVGCPEHGAQIKFRALRELGNAIADQFLDLACTLDDLQPEACGGPHDALAVQIEIWGDTLEGAATVKHAGAEPRRMGHGAHEHRVALVPFALVPGPGRVGVLRPVHASILLCGCRCSSLEGVTEWQASSAFSRR